MVYGDAGEKIQETKVWGASPCIGCCEPVASIFKILQVSVGWITATSTTLTFCFSYPAATTFEPPKRKSMLDPGYHSNKNMLPGNDIFMNQHCNTKNMLLISTNHHKYG